MKYDYSVYTPGGSICFSATSHSTDLQGKLTCIDEKYIAVAEFPVWHGLTRAPQPELLHVQLEQIQLDPAEPDGDFTTGPITFEALPADPELDDIPF